MLFAGWTKLGVSLSFLLVLIILLYAPSGIEASISRKKSTKCPGLYCGRTEENGECGACPRGYRPDSLSQTSMCKKCDDRISFYDALYLGFMALLSLLLHWFFIDLKCPARSKRSVILLHLCALLESVVSALVTLVLSDPVGSLEIRSCRVQQLSDWYTMLYNPSPDYVETIHCTQEVVYPLYTIVMIYYAFSMVLMMILRPFIAYKFVEGRADGSIYAALYFLPILIISQAVCGGLIYYSFPYIILVLTVVTNAIHFAFMDEGTPFHARIMTWTPSSPTVLEFMRRRVQESEEGEPNQTGTLVLTSRIPRNSIVRMIKLCFTNARHAVILFGHWLLHAYGIVALTRMETPTVNTALIALIPFPAIFYILTVSFTDPDNLDSV